MEVDIRGGGTVVERPEKKLVRFAMRLVILQRTSTAIGALGFFWGTTVILGHLASISYKTDFYFITIILITEWARNLSPGRDLEWSLESPWTISDALNGLANKVISVCNRGDLEAGNTNGNTQPLMADTNNHLPTTDQEEDHLLRPDADGLSVLSSNLRKLLYCLQLLSALSCITLSVVRVVQLSLGAPIDPTSSGDYTNVRAAVYVFYVIAIAQASVSLAEKVYWEWRITKLLDEVNRECNRLGMIPITSFFYHAYSKHVNGNIFDGGLSQLDLFSFASNFLNTHSRQQQIIGIRILHKFSTSSDHYSIDTLRNMGTSMPVMEKLLHMMSWKRSDEEEIREKAAEIVLKLAAKRWDPLRLSGLPGALVSICSLIDGANPPELKSLGITILNKLSDDCSNCLDIAASNSVMMLIISLFDFPAYHDHSAKTLNNICKFTGCNSLNKVLGANDGVITVAFRTLKQLMVSEVNRESPPQILVDLARLLVSYMNNTEANTVILKAGTAVPDEELLGDNQSGVVKLTRKLLQILQEYHDAIHERPNRLTREQWDKLHETTVNTVRLAIMTMKRVGNIAVTTMRNFGMEVRLRQIVEAITGSSMVDELRQILESMDHLDIHELINDACRLLAKRKKFPVLEGD